MVTSVGAGAAVDWVAVVGVRAQKGRPLVAGCHAVVVGGDVDSRVVGGNVDGNGAGE